MEVMEWISKKIFFKIKKWLYLSYALRKKNSDGSYPYQRGVVPSGTGYSTSHFSHNVQSTYYSCSYSIARPRGPGPDTNGAASTVSTASSESSLEHRRKDSIETCRRFINKRCRRNGGLGQPAPTVFTL